MLADGSLCKHEGCVCPFLAWPEVVVPPCFRVRPHGLHRVGAAVHEQPLVILDDLPSCHNCRSHLTRHLLLANSRIRGPCSHFPPDFRMWVSLDNPEYSFCQTAA